jgi:hypothetical protein
MNQEVKPVELILPESLRTAPSAPTTTDNSWWIAGIVVVVLLANAILVWFRLKGRDPLQRAFAGVAGKLGLNRAERERVRSLAGDALPPVALLLSDAAMEHASAAEPQDPLIVSVRQKVRGAKA